MQQEQRVNVEVPLQKTILLVEDHTLFSMIIKRAIEKSTSHRVIHIKDGSTIQEVIQQNKPHLLVLDYELPGKNGIELYDLVHQIEGYEHLPAIMVSAELPQQEIAQRNIVGLQKPCRTSELIQAAEHLLS